MTKTLDSTPCRLSRILRVRLLSTAFVALLAPDSHASHTCPTPQPSFSYVDVDNDGCHTSGVDSESVDAQLQTASTMADVPSFVAPADTGLVIPVSLVLPEDADPFWSVPNDVWIDGRVGGVSALRIEAGGTTYVNEDVRLRTRGFSAQGAGDLELGCSSGCGPTVVDNSIKLSNNGLAIYDAQIGDDVRISVRCSAGGVPSCRGDAYFARASSIGSNFRLSSPAGIQFEEGLSLLSIGTDARLTTRAVSIDGGVLGFSIEFELDAGVEFGAGARLRAGSSLTVQGGESAMLLLGPVRFGAGTRLTASTVIARGKSLEMGANSQLRGLRDISLGNDLSSVILAAADETLTVGEATSINAGRIRIDAGTGPLDVQGSVRLTTAGSGQYIVLEGSQVAVGPNAVLIKSTTDSEPITIAASSSVSVSSSLLQGAGLEVSVSDAAATIAFTGNEAIGPTGAMATFVAPGGVCDLTGSAFVKLGIDTSGCGSVVGP